MGSDAHARTSSAELKITGLTRGGLPLANFELTSPKLKFMFIHEHFQENSQKSEEKCFKVTELIRISKSNLRYSMNQIEFDANLAIITWII